MASNSATNKVNQPSSNSKSVPKTKRQSSKLLQIGDQVIITGKVLQIDHKSGTTTIKLLSSPPQSTNKHATISVSTGFLHSKQEYIKQHKILQKPSKKSKQKPKTNDSDEKAVATQSEIAPKNVRMHNTTLKSYFDSQSEINDESIQASWILLNHGAIHPKIMETESSQKCDAWFLNECPQTQRVLFVLQFYRVWIHKKQNRYQAPHIADFIERSLSTYSQHQLWNDFHHIRLFHILGNDDGDLDNVFVYFRKHMDHFKINYTLDPSLKRQKMDKENLRDTKYRRQLYRIEEDQYNDEREFFEMNVQRLLDTIHCTLLYHDAVTNHMKLPKRFIIEKVTEIKSDTGKKEAIEQASDEGSAMIGEYGLGINIAYWDDKWPIHCGAKYTNLKDELLNNKWYKLDEFEYHLMYRMSQIFLLSVKGKSMIARQNGGWNRVCNIAEGQQIAIEQVLVLIAYTNVPQLTKAFGATYAAQHHGESRADIVKRHHEIGIYGRLLSESVAFYSESLTNANVNFYLAFNFKVSFSKWQTVIYCPVAVTQNKHIAYRYTVEHPEGVILSLQKIGANGSLFLDNSYFSESPNEEERLLMLSSWSFDNVIYNGLSCKYYVQCLKLLRKIISGSFISRKPKLFKEQYQYTLIKMMDNYIARKSHQNQQMIHDEIPHYVQELFTDFCDEGIDYIWINKSEFSQCTEEFQSYFKHQSSSWWNMKKKVKYGKFASYLHKIGNKNIQIVTPPEIEWKINGSDLQMFWKHKRINGPHIRCHIGHVIKKTNYNELIDEEKENQDSNCIILFPQISRHSKHQDGNFKFEIEIKSKPEYISSFAYEVQWEIPQINYTFEGMHRSQGSGVYYNNLFDSIQLQKFNMIRDDNKEIGFSLNIIIKMFSCKDKKGCDLQNLPK